MKYDLENILTFVKNDENWIRKLIIGSLFIIASIVVWVIPFTALFFIPKISILLFIIAAFVCVIIGLAVYGYSLQAAHDYIKNPETKLPEWADFWSHVFVGLKAAVGSLLFYLPVLFLGAASLGLSIYLEKQSETQEMYKILLQYFNIIADTVYVVYMLFYSLFNANFIKDFNPFEFLNVSAAYKLLKNNVLNYLILALLILAVGVIGNIASVFLVLTIIGILLIPFVSMYIMIVCGVLTARFVQIAEESKISDTNLE